METGAGIVEPDQPANDVRSSVLYRVGDLSAGVSLFDLFRGAAEHGPGQTDLSGSWNILDGQVVCSILCLFQKAMARQAL